MRIALCNEVVRELPFARQCALAAALGYAGARGRALHAGRARRRTCCSAARRAEAAARGRGRGARRSASLHWLLVAPAGLSDHHADAGGARAHAGCDGAAGRPRRRSRRARCWCMARRRSGGCATPRRRGARGGGDGAGRRLGRGGGRDLLPGAAGAARDQLGDDGRGGGRDRAPHRLARRCAPCSTVCAAGNGEAEPPAALLDRWLPTGWLAHIHLNDRNRRGAGPGRGPLRARARRAAPRTATPAGARWSPSTTCRTARAPRARAIGYLRGIDGGHGRERAPRFRVIEMERREWPFRLRLPFRFGVITVTQGRQAVLRARIRDEDGREGWGVAAETLAAKWFDKDPALTDAQNEHQLRRALELAAAATAGGRRRTPPSAISPTATPRTSPPAGARRLNPLVASYGRALLDRAVLDALLKLQGVSFFAGMRAEYRRHGAARGGARPRRLRLRRHAGRPAAAAQHRMRATRSGWSTRSPPPTRPSAWTTACRRRWRRWSATYRHRYWKLKVGGERRGRCGPAVAHRRRARPRCRRLPRHARRQRAVRGRRGRRRAVARDGGGAAAGAAPRLDPLHRAAGEARAGAGDRHGGARRLRGPSSSTRATARWTPSPRAQALGYAGVSSKACKGVWRSLINLARCRAWNAEAGADRYFMSAEDLTTLAGVCVQQDLALVALLGLHACRAQRPPLRRRLRRPPEGRGGSASWRRIPDLYADTPRGPRLAIRDGVLEIGSLDTPGLGATAEPDYAAMEAMPRAEWP